MQNRFCFLLMAWCFNIAYSAKGQSVQVRGQISDAETGEPLPFAIVFEQNTKTGATADPNGNYQLWWKTGTEANISFRFTGYDTYQVTFAPQSDTVINVKLSAAQNILNEVEVTGNRTEDMAENTARTSVVKVTQKEIRAIPTIIGEADVIKIMQLMPGTLKGFEGSSDIFVRGGEADQNLVLFDDAIVYNVGHLFGFLSVFNPEVIGETEMILGGFPAKYGGRLSSILNVKSKYLDADRTKVNGGVGLISSRFAVETPIIKNKLSVMLAGRRTYIDQVVKLIGENLPYFFYDLNGKVDYRVSSKDRILYSFYAGDDVLNFERESKQDEDDPNKTQPSSRFGSDFTLGNITHSLRWEHMFGPKTISSVALTYTKFDYNIFNYFEDNRLSISSSIEDWGIKGKIETAPREGTVLTFGTGWTGHRVDPNLIESSGEAGDFIPSSEGETRNTLEGSVFAEVVQEFSNKWNARAGLRLSSALLENAQYFRPEPRMSLTYQWAQGFVLKGSYARMVQYMHRVSNASFALSTDLWYPVTEKINPQEADVFVLGWEKNWKKQPIMLRMEAYYKAMRNLIEYEEGTDLTFNNDFEESLVQGNGEAYGIEWLLKKSSGKLTGWLAYTLSWSNRQFDQLNRGMTFPSRYDRRHNVSVVGIYDFNDRWRFSAVWEFISGARFTPIIARYVTLNAASTGIDLIPVYPDRNAIKLADAHRLDVSVTLRNKPRKKFRSEWVLSVYNAYNRATPAGISISEDEQNEVYQYQQFGLFGAIPSMAWNFWF